MITGSQLIDAVARRLDEEDIRCHDSDIVRRVRELSETELNQLVTFGDVLTWHNDRVKGEV